MNFSILFIIYLILVIPIIIIYLEHGIEELQMSLQLSNQGNENKSIRTFAEGGFLFISGISYILVTVLLFLYPNNRVLPIVILAGTIIIFIIYFQRMMEGGMPIPFTDLTIQKYTVGIEGYITKVAQAILLIPISMLLQKSLSDK